MPSNEQKMPLNFSNVDTPCEASLLKTEQQQIKEKSPVVYVPRIKWLDLAAQIFIHAGCVYGLSLIFTHARLLTSLWGKQIHK